MTIATPQQHVGLFDRRTYAKPLPVARVYPKLKLVYQPISRAMTKSLLSLLHTHETGTESTPNPYDNDVQVMPVMDVPGFCKENGFKSFTVWTDPFDRLVSGYQLWQWDQQYWGKNSLFETLGFDRDTAFEEFVRSICLAPSWCLDTHWMPQARFVANRITGQPLVDQMYQMEKVEDWWAGFIKWAGLPSDTPIPYVEDPFDENPYDGYHTKETRMFTRIKYAEDFHLFKMI